VRAIVFSVLTENLN